MKTKLFLFIFFLFLFFKTTYTQQIKLVKDINLGNSSTLLNHFQEYNGKLIFYASTEQHGSELWISDGTEEGTNLVLDINQGPNGSIKNNAIKFIKYANSLFFNAHDDVNGEELWRTNGTTEGTRIVSNINEGSNSSSPSSFIANNGLYFSAITNAQGRELWVTDGTTDNTRLVLDNSPGVSNGSPGSQIFYRDQLYVSVSNPTIGVDVTKGAELRALNNGTYVLIKDINVGSGSSSPSNFFEFKGKLYFSANDGNVGRELWVTDGGENGTNLVKDLAEGFVNGSPASSSPSFFTEYNGSMYFVTDGSKKIWKSSGGENGTFVIKEFDNNNTGAGAFFFSSTVYNNKLYFWANDGTSGTELWVTDGTSGGTFKVTEINPNGDASVTRQLKVFNDKLYFIATDGVNDFKLWESDGTINGTKVVDGTENLLFKNNADGSDDLVVVDNKLFFFAYGDTYGQELYVLNPNAGKTYIPDDNFEQALIDKGFDDVLDDYVLTANIESVVNLSVINKNIADLTGIEDFTNLEILNVSNNTISILDLTSNKKLINLKAQNNQLSSINISGLNLKVLSVFTNNLTSLDVSNSIDLEELYCEDNNLTSLNIDKNNKLLYLNFDENSISTINVSNNSNLNYIYGKNNGLSTITLGEHNNLEELTLNNNHLQNINLDGLPNLIILELNNNWFENLNCNSLTNLQQFSVNDNFLEQIKFKNGNNTSITEFSTKSNIDLTCIEVDDVDYAQNNFTNIDNHTTFNTDCSDSWSINVDPTLQTVLFSIPNLDVNGDGNITISEAASFTGTLDLSNMGVTDINGLQAFTSITTLDLSGNSITDFTPLTGLDIEVISKSSKQIRKIVARSMSLENLIINDNNFETINLNALTNLKTINIGNNNDLKTVSIKNGNNSAITSFNSNNTPNLSCILVDNRNAAFLSTWNKDNANKFVETEAQCRSEVLSTEDFLQKDVKIYPNPVTNILQIESVKNIDFIEVYNTLGKRVMKTNIKKIDFSNYSSGMYILKIVSDNRLLTKRVMKN